jgi:2-polyprenyl-6-methoxyphenol hydroxylase-like FAD-dependent oxidoreductase
VSPVVHEMVRRMEPISPVYPSRATRNRWRHYERWRTPLGRFIAIADAACSYNPRFGQGMSAAAVSARLLSVLALFAPAAERRRSATSQYATEKARREGQLIDSQCT